MRIREHLTYANVAATIALAGVIGGGGAYAAGVIDSGDIENNSIESRDLRNRKAVRAADVRPDGLTGKQIKEKTLDALSFLPIGGGQGTCDPTGTTFVECAEADVRLASKGRLFVVATGEYFSADPDANLTCRIATDDEETAAGVSPGQSPDNTALEQTDGLAVTLVTKRLPKGQHSVALRCNEPTAGDGALASASIAVLGISG